MFALKKASYCDRCRHKCSAGTLMVHLQSGKYWCAPCADSPLLQIAPYDVSCMRCGGFIKRGEQKGWAPNIGTWCYFCVRGKDSTLASLPESERQVLQEIIERLKRLEALPRPISATAANEFKQHTQTLMQRFDKVRTAVEAIKKYGIIFQSD